jgi:hypothetical protein
MVRLPELVRDGPRGYSIYMESKLDCGVRCKLGPRESGRKNKGKAKPQAIRQAKARRDNLLQKLKSNG